MSESLYTVTVQANAGREPSMSNGKYKWSPELRKAVEAVTTPHRKRQDQARLARRALRHSTRCECASCLLVLGKRDAARRALQETVTPHALDLDQRRPQLIGALSGPILDRPPLSLIDQLYSGAWTLPDATARRIDHISAVGALRLLCDHCRSCELLWADALIMRYQLHAHPDIAECRWFVEYLDQSGVKWGQIKTTPDSGEITPYEKIADALHSDPVTTLRWTQNAAEWIYNCYVGVLADLWPIAS